MTNKQQIKLSLKDRARVKELYHIMPEMSACSIARQLGLNKRDTLNYMRLLGYSTESHREAMKTKMLPKRKIEIPKPKAPAPIVVKQPKQSQSISSKPSPETLEKKKQKMLFMKANKLLNDAIKASEKGKMDEYIRLRKEYEIAIRQAEAYKMRGSMSASDKIIYGLESQYHTII